MIEIGKSGKKLHRRRFLQLQTGRLRAIACVRLDGGGWGSRDCH